MFRRPPDLPSQLNLQLAKQNSGDASESIHSSRLSSTAVA